jgi:hypothetical protein
LKADLKIMGIITWYAVARQQKKEGLYWKPKSIMDYSL